MAMSREIPISVHPDFRTRTTSEDQGKPCTITRSSSLPCGPRINLVEESSNPSNASEDQASMAENTQNTGGIPRIRNETDKFTEFWKTGLPDHLKRQQNSSEGSPIELNTSEETGQRRHFFAQNPVVGDLVSVFEDYYTSAPRPAVKLGRRNTYSPPSSGESHLAPKLTRRNSAGFNRNETSFDVPIHVELHVERNGGNGNEENDLSESKARKENFIRDEGSTKPVSEADSVQTEHNKNCAFDDEIDMNTDDNRDEACVLEKPDENGEETERDMIHKEANTDQSQVEGIKDHREPLQSSPLQPQYAEAVEHDESKKKLLKIHSIIKKADELEKEVDAFNDSNKSKEYLILEEDLTCCLIELDGIETNRDENVRLARKRGVQMLQQTLARLEGKITPRSAENVNGEERNETSKISA